MGTILTILIYVGLLYLMMRYGCCRISHRSHSRRDAGNGDPSHGSHGGALTAKDPVCGMSVDPDGGYSRKYQGSDYWFCSRNCLDRFKSDPDRYTIEERLAS